MIFVSHDETFVNSVISRGVYSTVNGVVFGGDEEHEAHLRSLREHLPPGELWVLSKEQLKRFDGTFADYKKLVLKNLA